MNRWSVGRDIHAQINKVLFDHCKLLTILMLIWPHCPWVMEKQHKHLLLVKHLQIEDFPFLRVKKEEEKNDRKYENMDEMSVAQKNNPVLSSHVVYTFTMHGSDSINKVTIDSPNLLACSEPQPPGSLFFPSLKPSFAPSQYY